MRLLHEVPALLRSSLASLTQGIRKKDRRVRRRQLADVGAGGRVICITSGKGGTGKSFFSSNLAVLLARRGKRVALLDADLGLANAHLFLNVSPPRNLFHLLSHDSSLEETTIRGPAGVKLISGGSGLHEIACLTQDELFLLIRKTERLRRDNDFLLIDTSAGIGPQTLMFLFAAREIVLVTTGDLTAMTDGYAIVKTLLRRSQDFRISVVVNRVCSAAEATGCFGRIDGAARKFLGTELAFLGYLLDDPSVPASLARRNLLVDQDPYSPAGRGLLAIARKLLSNPMQSRELPWAVRQILSPADGRPGGSTGRNGSDSRPRPAALPAPRHRREAGSNPDYS